jgi:hypothetical protein
MDEWDQYLLITGPCPAAGPCPQSKERQPREGAIAATLEPGRGQPCLGSLLFVIQEP